jgi:hypothetical protein
VQRPKEILVVDSVSRNRFIPVEKVCMVIKSYISDKVQMVAPKHPLSLSRSKPFS